MGRGFRISVPAEIAVFFWLLAKIKKFLNYLRLSQRSTLLAPFVKDLMVFNFTKSKFDPRNHKRINQIFCYWPILTVDAISESLF